MKTKQNLLDLLLWYHGHSHWKRKISIDNHSFCLISLFLFVMSNLMPWSSNGILMVFNFGLMIIGLSVTVRLFHSNAFLAHEMVTLQYSDIGLSVWCISSRKKWSNLCTLSAGLWRRRYMSFNPWSCAFPLIFTKRKGFRSYKSMHLNFVFIFILISELITWPYSLNRQCLGLWKF